jgi:transcriptional regulator with XRE-family HTH domain
MNKKELIGKRIQELRKKQKLSQEQVAERAGINSNYVSRIERGMENPTLDMLLKISESLHVGIWEMLDFGLFESRKELRNSIQSITGTVDESTLRVILRVIRAITT